MCEVLNPSLWTLSFSLTDNIQCKVCHSPFDEDKMLTCDTCNWGPDVTLITSLCLKPTMGIDNCMPPLHAYPSSPPPPPLIFKPGLSLRLKNSVLTNIYQINTKGTTTLAYDCPSSIQFSFSPLSFFPFFPLHSPFEKFLP